MKKPIKKELLEEVIELAWTTKYTVSKIAKLVALDNATVRKIIAENIPFQRITTAERNLRKEMEPEGPERESLKITLKEPEMQRYKHCRKMRDKGFEVVRSHNKSENRTWIRTKGQ